MPMTKTKTELLKDARKQVPEVTATELSRQSPRPVILDVREQSETDAGMLAGAKAVPRGFLELRVEEAVPDRGADVVLYCAGGTRSLLAARTLQDMGYTRVRSLVGGFGAWKDAGLPVETPVRLTDAQRVRYSRHLLIPEVGEAGQAKLLKSKVLVIGAGGLGSPTALYLAAAGGGAVGLVRGDVPGSRALSPGPPPPELAPSCQEAGVLGVLPGVIGLVQAVEAVKLLLGRGEPLVGRLLLYDALEQRFREVKYARDLRCPSCGDAPMKELLPEYTEESCALPVRHEGSGVGPAASAINVLRPEA